MKIISDEILELTHEIFASFDVMYPREWPMAIKGKVNEAISIWSKAICNYTPDEIQKAITYCEELLSPPSLGKFKQLCRPPKPKQNADAYQRLESRDYKLLTQYQPRTITGMAEMRLINLTEGRPVQDYDDTTEDAITAYYRTRVIDPDLPEHPIVTEFLNTAKMIWHSPA